MHLHNWILDRFGETGNKKMKIRSGLLGMRI